MSVSYTYPFDAIVFDLGGVLIELSGIDRMLELLQHQLSAEELVDPLVDLAFGPPI